MSELQKSLLFAGLLIIALVWAVNQFQLWRVRQRTGRHGQHGVVSKKEWYGREAAEVGRQEPILEGMGMTADPGHEGFDFEPILEKSSFLEEGDEMNLDRALESEERLTSTPAIGPQTGHKAPPTEMPKVSQHSHRDHFSRDSLVARASENKGIDKAVADATVTVRLNNSLDSVVAPPTAPPVVAATPMPVEIPDVSIASEASTAASSVEIQSKFKDDLKSAIGAVSPIKNRHEVIDPLLDCVIPLALEYPVPGERVLPLLSHLRHVGNKIISCEGFNLATHSRQMICAGQRYRDICLAVQLANRHGPLNALEFSEFIGGVQEVSQALEGQVTLPEAALVLAQARELDAFAQAHDIQLTIHVQSVARPLVAADIYTRLIEDGLVLARDGTHFTYYHPHAASAPPAFTLRFHNCNFLRDDLAHCTGEQIELCFDAPRSAEEIRPLRLMWLYAAHLAKAFGAVIVDDHGNLLAEPALIVIESRLKEIYTRLRQYGIVAGSPSASRLFSV